MRPIVWLSTLGILSLAGGSASADPLSQSPTTIWVADPPTTLPNLATAPSDPWSALGFQADGWQRIAETEVSESGVRLQSRTAVLDPEALTDNPFLKKTWQAEESLQVEMFGPFFAFARAGANSQSVDIQHVNMTGQTGVGCKFALWPKAEVQLRGGPRLNVVDSLTQEQMQQDARWGLELKARTPLIGALAVEYTADALPAVTYEERDRISQDFRLAVPVGRDGQFHLGTRYQWEANTLQPAPWTDRLSMYLGLTLKR